MNFYIETLGCARNQVDSDLMSERLLQAGFSSTKDPSGANVIVVNTCSFINSAINESVDTILELSRFKKYGLCKKIVVVGCLPERFREEIIEALPEVNFFLGTGGFDKIVSIVQSDLDSRGCILPHPDSIVFDDLTPRKHELQHSAYLKIAEGCSRNCSYCIIPKLRGKQKSRPLYQIISEAKELISSGVKEINLVAQDTTAYGRDLSNGVGFDILLANLAKLSKDVWIRFLYGHPESITGSVIKTIALHNNLCAYFDLPIQHVSMKILEGMNRSSRKECLISLFKNIRDRVYGAILRTTLIVGFPGETNFDFMELEEFLDKIKFDNLGVFTYSDSKDLASHVLPNHVDNETALYRQDTLMSKQLEISRDNLKLMVGKTVDVLIDGPSSESNLYEGRSMKQAPEVDGITYVRTNKDKEIKIGSVIPVKITDSLEYDLIGEPHD